VMALEMPHSGVGLNLTALPTAARKPCLDLSVAGRGTISFRAGGVPLHEDMSSCVCATLPHQQESRDYWVHWFKVLGGGET
jgi:hypothetical protein